VRRQGLLLLKDEPYCCARQQKSFIGLMIDPEKTLGTALQLKARQANG